MSKRRVKVIGENESWSALIPFVVFVSLCVLAYLGAFDHVSIAKTLHAITMPY